MKDAQGHGSNGRYHVVVQPYSLGFGAVGKPVGEEKVFSKHSSLDMAGKKAGSLISGAGRSKPQAHAGLGNGYRLFVRDTHTGTEYSRNQARDMVQFDRIHGVKS